MKYIIVIDDSITIRAIVELVLKNLGYKVQGAENGEGAIQLIKEIRENGDDVALCISDINMPVMDGLTFLHEFKRLDKFTPVIMLTTEAEDSTINEIKELGAADWIIKPFQPEKLLDAVKKLLK